MKTIWFVPVMFVLTVILGCAPAASPENTDSSSTKISDPVITQLTYIKNGSTVTELAPFSVSRKIYPDLGTGSCASSPQMAEVTISGTFDSVTTTELSLTGPSTQTPTLSGDTFSITTCVASGSILYSLKALGANGASSSTVRVSLLNTPTLSTIAAGHTSYPSPGFRTLGTVSQTTSLTSGTYKARAFSVGEHSTNTIASTGNTNLTMEVGFTNIIKQENP